MHCLFCFSLGDALLSRHTGIDIEQLSLTTHIANTHSGEVIKIFHMHVISYCPVQISWFCKEKKTFYATIHHEWNIDFHIVLHVAIDIISFLFFTRCGEVNGRKTILLQRFYRCENALFGILGTFRRNFLGLGQWNGCRKLCKWKIFIFYIY